MCHVSYPVHINGEKILDELVDMKRQRDIYIYIELLVVLTHISSYHTPLNVQVVRGKMFLTSPSVSQSVRQSWFFLKCNSS